MMQVTDNDQAVRQDTVCWVRPTSSDDRDQTPHNKKAAGDTDVRAEDIMFSC